MLLGNGLGFWKTMPIRCRRPTGSMPGPEISSPSNRTSPSMRAPWIRSFIRLKQRIRVLLPQPEGPIRAVIWFRGMSMVMSRSARDGPYQTESPRVDRTIGSGATARLVAADGVTAGTLALARSLWVSERLIKDLMGLGVLWAGYP